MSLKAFSQLDGRVYVSIADEETGLAFLQQAEAEGFTYCDGTKPTSRTCHTIMALNADKTLSYVGFAGHMAYGHGSPTIGTDEKPFIRVDYKKYLETGEFLYGNMPAFMRTSIYIRDIPR